MERQAKDGTFYQKVGQDEWQEINRVAKDGTVYKKVGQDEWAPKSFSTDSYSAENIASTRAKSAENAKGMGAAIYDNVVDPVMTAIDYTYAPIRQAMAAPAKAIAGDPIGAVIDPIRQLARSPKEAPTSAQVAEMYGVKKEKDVSPFAVTNPLMASTYENDPMPDDKENVKIYPSTQAGMLMDTALGGEGINLAAKGINKVAGGISSGAKKIAEITSPARQKPNTEQILAAAERLGIKVTPAMLDDSKFIERMEYTLANSPSLWGQSIARKQDAVKKGMQSATQNLTSDAKNLSKAEIGEQFKSGLTAKVGERLDPISETFNEIAQNTKSVPIPQKSKEAIIRNIQNLDDVKLTGGGGKPGQYIEMLNRAENADHIKKIVSYINDDLKTASGPEKFALGSIKEKLLNLEKNSVTRAAIQTARDLGQKGSTGQKIGNELIKDLQGARKGYRELSQDLTSIGESARLKPRSGPMSFLDEVEKVPSENIQAKFFNVNNNRQLKSLQEKFPEQFDLLKQGKLKDIAESAIDFSQKGKGETNTAKFLKEVRSLTPESKKMLFGENTRIIDDLETIQKTLPENFNPSGTASQQSWQEAIARNVKDIPNYVLYRGATSNLGKKISEGARKGIEAASDLPKISENVKSIPEFAGKSSSTLRQLSESPAALVASADKPKKGPEKWANDGAKKLIDSGIDQQTIEKLINDPKGKKLLIEASDLTPKSKAMENVMQKIRTGNLNKGEQ